MTDYEAKAREVVKGHLPKMAYDSYLDGDYDTLVSAIASALREAEARGQNDIWLWLDDDSAADPIMNRIVKSWMVKHKRARNELEGKSDAW